MENQRRVAFVTLGCKVNASETEGMRTLFEAAGYRAVSEGEPADVCVINTCTVTNTGDQKSRQQIRRARRLNPEAIVAAVGCYVQVSPEEAAAIPGVDLVLGNNLKHRIVALVEACMARKEELAASTGAAAPVETPSGAPAGVETSIESRSGAPAAYVLDRRKMSGFEELPIADLHGQTRAFLKIQDGCDRFCAYCIIPYARGPVRSRRTADVLAEAGRLSEKGFSEMVLTGIHLTSFRDEDGQEGLMRLIEALDAMPGVARIRLGSLEPVFLTPAFLDRLARTDKFCPHFHLSLQSGSEGVLQRMNRRYEPDGYRTILQDIRSRFPDAAVTTDVMVGFPGETDLEFEESLAFCRESGFAWMHVFPYSPRKGTPAASRPDQVPKSVKEARAAAIGRLAEAMRTDFQQRMAGRTFPVVFEQPVPGKPGFMEGYTPNYIQVAVPGGPEIAGACLPVALENPDGERMTGSLVRPGHG